MACFIWLTLPPCSISNFIADQVLQTRACNYSVVLKPASTFYNSLNLHMKLYKTAFENLGSCSFKTQVEIVLELLQHT